MNALKLFVVSSVASSVVLAAGDLSKAAEKVAPSVVTIHASRSGGAEDTGAGVVLHTDGFVATTAHLVAQADTVSVQFKDGTLSAAHVVTLSRSEDAALLKVDKLPSGVTAATLGDSDKVKAGQNVFTWSAANSALSGGQVRSVRASDPNIPIGPKKAIQVDVALAAAGTGSPVFDDAGNMIGLLSGVGISGAKLGEDTRGFATPANELRKRLFENPLPYVGMSLRYVGPEMAKLFNWPVESAFLVEYVKPGSAADNGGIKGGSVDAIIGGVLMKLGGDLIVKVGNLDVSKPEEIGKFLKSRKAGGVLHYVVLRAGKEVPLDVLVEEGTNVPPLTKK